MKDQEELNISPVALPRASEAVNLICDLLRSATSSAVVTDFLKSKNISSSAGSWDEMKEKRLLPALQQQKITVADLKRLLSEAEEFGHNHIFLYHAQAARVAKFFDQAQLRSLAKSAGIEPLLNDGRLLNIPIKPTLAEIVTKISRLI